MSKLLMCRFEALIVVWYCCLNPNVDVKVLKVLAFICTEIKVLTMENDTYEKSGT